MTTSLSSESEELLFRFCASQDVVELRQAAAVLRSSARSSAEIADGLVHKGLLCRFRAGPAIVLYVLTEQGQRVSDRELEEGTGIDARDVGRLLLQGWMWAAGLLGVLLDAEALSDWRWADYPPLDGDEVLSNREMRAADRLGRSRSMLGGAPDDGGFAWVEPGTPRVAWGYPDLAVMGGLSGWTPVYMLRANRQIGWMAAVLDRFRREHEHVVFVADNEPLATEGTMEAAAHLAGGDDGFRAIVRSGPELIRSVMSSPPS